MTFGLLPPAFYLAICLAGPNGVQKGVLEPLHAVVPCAERNDEMWLVSTRHIDCPDNDEPANWTLDVRRRDESAGWVTTTLDDLLAQPPLPTVIYVHGNRVDWCASFANGWRAYRHLADCDSVPPRVRFIIWSWPSDQIRRPLRDVRAKADRADSETILFGSFLSRVDPTTPLGLIGYSYGCRIIGGGLHLIAGGTLRGMSVSAPSAENRAVRVAMLAAAMDHDGLCAGYEFGAALPEMDRLLVLYNSCDPALQRYDFIDRCSQDSALGYVGLPAECLERRADSNAAGSIRQLNVSGFIGRSHSETDYFGSSNLMAEVCHTLFAD